MSGSNFESTPDNYSGDNIGAAGYGATAIGTQQSTLPTGGVVANPHAYTAGSSPSTIQSGGKKSMRRSIRRSQSFVKWGGKKSSRRSIGKSLRRSISQSCVKWGGKRSNKVNRRKSKRS